MYPDYGLIKEKTSGSEVVKKHASRSRLITKSFLLHFQLIDMMMLAFIISIFTRLISLRLYVLLIQHGLECPLCSIAIAGKKWEYCHHRIPV